MNKKYFPGANTGVGFVNLFDGIVPFDSPAYTYVLKGGPGVGKNTLMKRVAQAALQKGYELEEFHCASDPNSFDAIRIIDENIVLLDGTAPHIVDPIYPGCADEIINLGRFKNREEFMNKRGIIADLFRENKEHYKIAYSYLAAARELKKTALSFAEQVIDVEKLMGYMGGIIENNPAFKAKNHRKLFLKSITPDGVVDFSETVSAGKKIISFGGISGAVIVNMLAKLYGSNSCEYFMDSILPNIVSSINFGGDNIFIENSVDRESEEFILSPLPEFTGYSMEQVAVLTDNAVEELSKCKAVHDKIESIYRPFVNYDAVDMEGNLLLTKLRML